jgi:hypothetical protein
MPEDSPLSGSNQQYEPSRGPWLGLGIGAVIILGIIAYLIYSSRTGPNTYTKPITVAQSAPEDPYAAKVEIKDAKMAQAQNILGGTMTYLEAKITNTGDKTIVGAGVEATFRNSLNQVVQREVQPLMIITQREPAMDIVAVNNSPLKPGDTKDLQLTFEHISADWNRQYPELRLTTITEK